MIPVRLARAPGASAEEVAQRGEAAAPDEWKEF